MELVVAETVRNKCEKKLSEVGASSTLSTFYGDVVQCDEEMTRVVHQVRRALDASVQSSDRASAVFTAIQTMTKQFYGWRTKIKALVERVREIEPFEMSPIGQLTAGCAFQTGELSLQQGDDVVITDTTSTPNWFRVRSGSGNEGYIPALSCIIALPDWSPATAVERLQIQLMTSWSDCLRAAKSALLTLLQQTFSAESAIRDVINTTQRLTSRRLTCIHRLLCWMETLLIMPTGRPRPTDADVETLSRIDKSVLCYQTCYSQWKSYQSQLRQATSYRPLRVVDDQLPLRLVTSKFKYYELAVNWQEVRSVEELTYTTRPADTEPRQLESVQTQQMTSEYSEERSRYVIKSVIDPRNRQRISLERAVADGVVDYTSGQYVDVDCGRGMPLAEAMRTRKIVVDYFTTRRSIPIRDVTRVITLRRRVVDSDFQLDSVVDARTAELVDCRTAIERQLIELTSERDGRAICHFINRLTGERLTLADAVQLGWVHVKSAEVSGRRDALFTTCTHQVVAVVDGQVGRMMSCDDALRRRLFDTDTGWYTCAATGRRVAPDDAIRQGLIKTRRLDDCRDDDLIGFCWPALSPVPATEVVTSTAESLVDDGTGRRTISGWLL